MIIIVYIILLSYQIVLLVKAIKRKETERWVLLLIFEAVSSVFAFVMAQYFGQAMASMIATLIYMIMLAITILACVIVYSKSNKKKNKK